MMSHTIGQSVSDDTCRSTINRMHQTVASPLRLRAPRGPGCQLLYIEQLNPRAVYAYIFPP
jgi:hypothetical protein